MGAPNETTGDSVIRELPELVKNQIAAGEVIERPASVVKELVENALDAGATHIEVELEEGGAKRIRITDDGVGMNAADLLMAFVPHATSKLREVDDLDHIASLGFRGEALASIGSVARASIYSRQRDAETGLRIGNEGGRIEGPVEAGGPRGTTVDVRDLFFNTPARRRFLKRTSTELSRCLDVVQRTALAQPGVGFVVTHGGKRVFDVEAAMDLRARIRRTFGAELESELVAIDSDDGRHHLYGFVAPPRFSRRDASRQLWFLNGRPVRDRVLARIVKEGYRGFLVEGRQPVVFLHLAMDPSMVDVNVHPAKSEVRFREDRRLFGACVNALREAVATTDMSTPGESMLRSAWKREGRTDTPGQGHLADPGVLRPTPPPLVVREVPGRPFDAARSESAPNEGAAPASGSAATPTTDPARVGRALGASSGDVVARAAEDRLDGPFLQVAKTYLVRALPNGFEIVDQHALHERITYERLLGELRGGGVEVQRFLVPELVELSRAETELVAGHADELARIGIELGAMGESTIAVHGVPARLRAPNVEGLVRDVANVLARTGKAPAAEDVIEEVLHSAACRSSVMAGDALSEDEIRTLLQRGRELESDQTCPHARPTRVTFTLEDLEKAFHRR